MKTTFLSLALVLTVTGCSNDPIEAYCGKLRECAESLDGADTTKLDEGEANCIEEGRSSERAADEASCQSQLDDYVSCLADSFQCNEDNEGICSQEDDAWDDCRKGK